MDSIDGGGVYLDYIDGDGVVVDGGNEVHGDGEDGGGICKGCGR